MLIAVSTRESDSRACEPDAILGAPGRAILPPALDAKGHEMSSSKGTILIVEDEFLIAMGIQMQLEELGFEAVVATTISEALAVAQQQPLRLAILDYDLHG